MKAFSPAGMAVKAFYGGGARSIGNPDGASSGGGAYARGGANANGPNQGGGGGGGGSFHGLFLLDAGTAGLVGFSDGVFQAIDPAAGSVLPTSLSGSSIGVFFWAFASHGNSSVVLGMYGTHLQTDFTQVSFTDQFGTPKVYLASAATFIPNSANTGFQWSWHEPTQSFIAGGMYTITVT